MANTKGNQHIGGSVQWFRELNSTQDELRRIVQTSENTDPGLVIAARNQTAGKGMGENVWEGEPNKNLASSFYLRPAFLNPDQQFYINIFTSLAVFDLVRSLLKRTTVKIKWPNDIYAGKGKIAGILIQHAIRGNRIEHSLVGIGINANQLQFETSKAVSLRMLTDREHDVHTLLSQLLDLLNQYYTRIKTGELDVCRNAYKSALLGIDQWMHFRYRNTEIIARITGISPLGFLQLETETKKRIECDLKEIEFII
jgi:BirA family biotin operon repressor/biotin-[acetyl-CoA-carboxylase] ligase